MSADVNLDNGLFDFHTHSNMSDGDCKPSNVVALAKMRNIKYLALTDHDKVTGIEEALVSANENSIKLASGFAHPPQWLWSKSGWLVRSTSVLWL